MRIFKSCPKLAVLCKLSLSLFLISCSVNPATGDRQFTALLPASSESQVGAQEHQKIQGQYGSFMTGRVADYVTQVGRKVAVNTERKDVQYQFYVIDTPMVNAFALPGGYVYVSRGLLTLANDESELAAVLGHEIGHVTARHAAERMSQGFLAGIGATAVGIATGSNAISQVVSVGSDLYLKSYSRGQEHQSDELGVRYLSRAGYDPMAMARFLRSLDAQSKLEAKEAGKEGTGFNYFSTHPLTAERVAQATAEGRQFPVNSTRNRAQYLSMINGLTYGDSAAQGFARGNTFYHPVMGFAFDVPNGSKIQNAPSQVVAAHSNGTLIVFDMAKDKTNTNAASYLMNNWLKGDKKTKVENITINGMRAATTAFAGTVQNRQVNIRLVAIEWGDGTYGRFQYAMPKTLSQTFISELQKSTYSFRRLSASEKASVQPKKLIVLEAPADATVNSMASRMQVDGNKREKFRVLNGMLSGEKVVAGQPYKIVIN